MLGLSQVDFLGKQVLRWSLGCGAFIRDSMGINFHGSKAKALWDWAEGAAELRCGPSEGSADSMGRSGTWRGPSGVVQSWSKGPRPLRPLADDESQTWASMPQGRPFSSVFIVDWLPKVVFQQHPQIWRNKAFLRGNHSAQGLRTSEVSPARIGTGR